MTVWPSASTNARTRSNPDRTRYVREVRPYRRHPEARLALGTSGGSHPAARPSKERRFDGLDTGQSAVLGIPTWWVT